MNAANIALLALVPMMAGPIDQRERAITARLCNGGTLVIPVGEDDGGSAPHCPQKVCHAGTCRKRV